MVLLRFRDDEPKPLLTHEKCRVGTKRILVYDSSASPVPGTIMALFGLPQRSLSGLWRDDGSHVRTSPGARLVKEIHLVNGKGIALVDDEDYEELSKHKWYCDSWGYAKRYVPRRESTTGKKTQFCMHRQILKLHPSDRRMTDHIDRNTLNNQKFNLRICTASQNSKNRGAFCTNKSGYLGVAWEKGAKRWRAVIQIGKSRSTIGYFDDPKEAYIAYCLKAVEIYGEFAPQEAKEVAASGANYNPYIGTTNKTGLKGVNKCGLKKWVARIYLNGVRIEIGRFSTPEEAHAAYCRVAEEKQARREEVPEEALA